VGRFNLRKLNELEVSEQYQTEISNRLATLENLSESKDINRALEKIKENIKTSATDSLCLHELKQHKSWFDEECSHFLDHRKQVKIQCIQDLSHSSVDNLHNVRHEASGHFRNKSRNIRKLKLKNLKLTVR
jgi:RNA binding exosome subunit